MAIHVLHIIGSLKLGGAQICVKQLVEHNDDPEIEHFVYPLRSKQVDIPIEGNVIKLPYRNYDPRKFFAIFKLCKQYDIDIIHAHLHKPILGALLARFFINIPVVVHEHCSIAYRGLQYSIYRFILRIIKHKANLYIAVSKATVKDLKYYANVDPQYVQMVYNAVDFEKFTPNAEKRDILRREFGIGQDDMVLGFVGRISYVKGTELIIEALSLLLKENPHYLAVFLGRGPQQHELIYLAEQRGIANRVKFLGFRKNVSDILNVFDIALMPSRKEGLPLTTLEYMTMKIPVISSGVDGMGEILTDQENAVVLKENTPSCICENVLRLANDPDFRQSLINNAHRYVQDFSIPRFVQQINEIYRKLANRN
ncbi:MAG: glycosyltransferase [Phycisphaerae bacterium]|nr:glycosyltransferase [Phycisphaerae bacterium]